MDFLQETVAGLARAVRDREVSARELVDHALARIDAVDPLVNAFVAVDPEGARRQAAAVDELVATGQDAGPLAGIPLAVKDLEDAAGLPTTRGSARFLGRGPAAADSTLVARLRDAGCVVVGKTNTPELGYQADTRNATFGATRNPWALDRSPGGSSGGSAAAIAAGMVPLATGSDGGGSIRVPSALCGLSGMKPSLGRVPCGGPQPPDWADLSTRGPMARSILDVALALDAVIGPDPADLRSLPMPDASWAGAVADPHVPYRVAWSPTLGYATPDAEVLAICERALGVLEDLGAEVVPVDVVFDTDPLWTWLCLTGTYLARTLADAGPPPAPEDLEPGLRAHLASAQAMTAVDLARAQDECHRLNSHLVRLFADTRLLLTPTTAAPAPLSGRPGVVNGEATRQWVQYTYPFNCTRSPAGTVCAGVTAAGTPVGLQVVGPQHGDAVVLRALAALERAIGLPDPPPLG